MAAAPCAAGSTPTVAQTQEVALRRLEREQKRRRRYALQLSEADPTLSPQELEEKVTEMAARKRAAQEAKHENDQDMDSSDEDYDADGGRKVIEPSSM